MIVRRRWIGMLRHRCGRRGVRHGLSPRPKPAGGGLYKSSDGGDTWKQLTGGLPTDDFVGKIGVAISPSKPKRL
jgi:hypothetical protein